MPASRFIRLHLTALILVAGSIVLPLVGARGEPPAAAKAITVFAAASLRNVLEAASTAIADTRQPKPIISLAASSALAKQIELGAPADVFISADEDWMAYLAQRDLIVPETRTIVASNRLVLIAPAASTASVTLEDGVDLGAVLGNGRLAVADVKAVPAGKYAKAALQKLNAWDSVESKLAQSENVRAALALVSRGEAPLGIVYASDAKADATVRTLAVFPPGSHPPIVYPAAVLKSSAMPDAAKSFLSYLTSAEGQAAFAAQGFGPAP